MDDSALGLESVFVLLSPLDFGSVLGEATDLEDDLDVSLLFLLGTEMDSLGTVGVETLGEGAVVVLITL